MTRSEQQFIKPYDQLLQYIQSEPHAVAFRYYDLNAALVSTLSYQSLFEKSQSLANELVALSRPEDRVILLFETGPEFIISFFSCMALSLIAVPVPPLDEVHVSLNKGRLTKILAHCGSSIILTTSQLYNRYAELFDQLSVSASLRIIQVDFFLATNSARPLLIAEHSVDIAYLQYTSGSTNAPKGVMVSYKNLYHNVSSFLQEEYLDHIDHVVSWVPHYHDLGLCFGYFFSFYGGYPCALLSPLDVIKRPLLWLELITQFPRVMSGGPNFIYQYCVEHIRPEQFAHLDLSTWHVAGVGAEPARMKTLDQFSKQFSPCGFNKKAFCNGYGLAENVLAVSAQSFKHLDDSLELSVDQINQANQHRGFQVQMSPVSVGRPLLGQHIKIIGQDGLELNELEIGEVLVQSDSVCLGYWQDPQQTKQTFSIDAQGRWLKTGDLGLMHKKNLYITGRNKDLIIRNGVNYFAEDIEQCIAEYDPLFYRCRILSFSVLDVEREQLVVMIELDKRHVDCCENELKRKIETCISNQFGLVVDIIMFLVKRTLLMTSSGKIRRAPNKANFESKALTAQAFVFNQNNVMDNALTNSCAAVQQPASAESDGIDVSVFYFSSECTPHYKGDLYYLYRESCVLADKLGFKALWTPERHFHPFGGLFPNPAVLSAYIASLTQNIRIRSGSVVLPLHDPIRVVEEWSVVDNLSNGRVDLGVASGWHKNDFILKPAEYAHRHEHFYESIELIRDLWLGKKISRLNGEGELLKVELFPKPVQDTLGLWVTCTANEQSFVNAGALGANVITALLRINLSELERFIVSYHRSLIKSGFDPKHSSVTLMVHTFIGDNEEEVYQRVKPPFIDYLNSSTTLWKDHSDDLENLSAEDQAELLEVAFDKYYTHNALFGTVDSCAKKMQQYRNIGVDEVACLIDFGIEAEQVLANLKNIKLAASKVSSAKVVTNKTEPARKEQAQSQQHPNSNLDDSVVAILAKILKRPSIDPDSYLSEQGIDSLKAMQLLHEFNEQLHIDIDLQTLLTFEKMAQLIEYLSQLRTRTRIVTDKRTVPLSLEEQRLYFIEQCGNYETHYNYKAIDVQFKGSLDLTKLRQAIARVCQQQPMFSAVFQEEAGSIVKVIDAINRVQILQQSSSISDKEQHVQSFIQGPLDISQGQLLKILLLDLGNHQVDLVILIHHIICDANIIRIIMEQVSDYYNHEQVIDTPFDPHGYDQYLQFQTDYLNSQERQKAMDFWHHYLLDYEPFTPPRDRPYLQKNNKGSLYRFRIVKPQLINNSNAITLYQLLLLSFGLVLHLYTDEVDMVVGTYVDIRSRKEFASLIGYFINLLPLRIRLDLDKTVQHALLEMKNNCLSALNYRMLPFEDIVKNVTDKESLISVLVTLQPNFYPNLALDDVDITINELDMHLAKFPLIFDWMESDTELECRLFYQSDLFRQEFVVGMATEYQLMIEKLADAPEAILSSLLTISPADEQRVFKFGRIGEPIHPPVENMNQLLVHQVEHNPTHIVLEDSHQRMSYQDFFQAVLAVCDRIVPLIQAADLHEQFIGVCIQPSCAMVYAITAVLYLGKAYVPLDPAYPKERLSYIIEDVGFTHILCDEHTFPMLESLHLPRVHLLLLPSVLGKAQQSHLVHAETKLPAAVIYTSGTTGKPKGSVLTHEGIVNCLQWMHSTYQLLANDVVLQKSSLSFDSSIWEIFWPLLFGGSLLIADSKRLVDPHYLLKTINEKKIDYFDITPSMLEQLIHYMEVTGECITHRPKGIVSGGEALTSNLAKRMALLIPDCLMNGYGPTETSITVSRRWVSIPGEQGLSVEPLGGPIANIHFYVLNQKQALCPVNVPGELYIGGIGVTAGYLKNPKLSAERFIANPYVLYDKEVLILYRTGDKVRWLDNGELEFFGRFDKQVKVRGYRIELKEIEHVIRAYPGIESACVLIKEMNQSNKIVAYYSSSVTLEQQQLVEWLNASLPAFMIPHYWVAMEKMPLLPSGKINVRELPSPELDTLPVPSQGVEMSALEHSLLDMYQQVLGTRAVGVEDSFFSLGGDSIQSIQVITKLTQLSIFITYADIVQHASVAALARYIERTPAKRQLVSSAANLKVLSPIQHWFFSLNLRHPNHYNQAALVVVQPDVSYELVQDALSRVINEHEMLHLEFDARSHTFHKPKNTVKKIKLIKHTISDKATQHEWDAFIDRQHEAIDVQQNQLIRCVWVTYKQANYLLIVAHHLIIDAYSWTILLEDLDLVVAAMMAKAPLSLVKTSSYYDWSIPFYREGMPACIPARGHAQELSTPMLRSDYSFCMNDIDYDKSLTVASQVLHTDVADLLLFLVGFSLARCFSLNSLVINAERHGREVAAAGKNYSRTIGWFTLLVPYELHVQDVALEYMQLLDIKQLLSQFILYKKEQEERFFYQLSYKQEESYYQSSMPFCVNYLGKLYQTFKDKTYFTASELSVGNLNHIQNDLKRDFDLLLYLDKAALKGVVHYNASIYGEAEVQHFERVLQQNLLKLIDAVSSTGDSWIVETL